MSKCDTLFEYHGTKGGAQACLGEMEKKTKKPHFIQTGWAGVQPAPREVYFVDACSVAANELTRDKTQQCAASLKRIEQGRK